MKTIKQGSKHRHLKDNLIAAERFSRFSREEEIELTRRGQEGDDSARNQVVLSIYGLIYSHAIRMCKNCYSVDAAELAQIGIEKVIRVFDKFDPVRARASTYLGTVAQREMANYMFRKSSVIALPSTPTKHLMEHEERAGRMLSFDHVFTDQSDNGNGALVTLGSIALFDRDLTADERAIHCENLQRLRVAMQHLAAIHNRAWMALTRRSQGMTLSAIGREMGVTRERVRQLSLLGLDVVRKIMKVEVEADCV